MAPKRRSSTQAASSQRNQQATIAFGKQGLNKVTKNATQHSAKSSKKEAALVNLLSDDEITVDTTSIAEKQQAKVEPVESKPCTQELSEEETRARNMTDAQIKTYWRNKEAERKAPRVHQQALDVTEKMLREFDMSNQYGPCIGISRLQRWKRASTLGLSPPIQVLAVLLKEDDKKVQRAHVDELMSGRFAET